MYGAAFPPLSGKEKIFMKKFKLLVKIMSEKILKFLRNKKYGTGKKAAIIVSILIAVALILFAFFKIIPYIIVLIVLSPLIPDSFWERFRQQKMEEEYLRQKNRHEFMESILLVIIHVLKQIGEFFPIKIPKDIPDMNPIEMNREGILVVRVQVLLRPRESVDWKDFVYHMNNSLRRYIEYRSKNEGAFPFLIVISADDDSTCYGYGYIDVAVTFSQVDAQRAEVWRRSFLNELPDIENGEVYDEEF